MDEKIIMILVDRIKNKKMNPITEKLFSVEDIKLSNYKDEVKKRLLE